MPFAPKHPEPSLFLLQAGAALRAQGQHEAAVAKFVQAAEVAPSFAEAHHQLGNALKSLHRYPEAIVSLRRASQLAPEQAPIWLNLGVALLAVAAVEEAIASFQRAVKIEPNRPEAHNVLGSAFLEAGRTSEAAGALHQALRLRSAYPAAHDNLGRTFRAQGLPAEALREFRAALAGQPQPGTHSNFLYALNFVPDLPPAEVFAEHVQWAQTHAKLITTAKNLFDNDRDPGRRLKVGYVSPDFVHHAVAYFIEPVLTAHDRDRIEAVCYSNAPVGDAVTARLRKASDVWRDISTLGDEAAAARIREDRIDILVDLAGHTARNRLLVFARSPAPVQVTWLGYPNTTGLGAIRWKITDSIADPEGRTDAFCSERLFRLPGPFSCYRPPAEAPQVAPPPSLRNGYITFGSFNHFSKLNPAVLELWSHLLAKVPRSRLLLKARSLADEATAARVRRIFAAAGVDAGRLDLRHLPLPVPAHLAMYGEVDIALDPFPYNGTTTTCEALWMGVPVLALAGETHVGRVSAGLLTHLGRAEWIADSTGDYLEKGSALASDLSRLAEYRADQRERMRLSPLCDAAKFTDGLEQAFRRMWQAWLDETNQQS